MKTPTDELLTRLNLEPADLASARASVAIRRARPALKAIARCLNAHARYCEMSQGGSAFQLDDARALLAEVLR